MYDRPETAEEPTAARTAGLRRLSRLTWRATQLSAVTAVGFATLFARAAPAQTTAGDSTAAPAATTSSSSAAPSASTPGKHRPKRATAAGGSQGAARPTPQAAAQATAKASQSAAASSSKPATLAPPSSAPAPAVMIRDGGLATSSPLGRSWQRDGTDLHHIIDPATWRPARSCWRTASIAVASCVHANIASTAAILRGERAVRWLDGLRAWSGTTARSSPWPDGPLTDQLTDQKTPRNFR